MSEGFFKSNDQDIRRICKASCVKLYLQKVFVRKSVDVVVPQEKNSMISTLQFQKLYVIPDESKNRKYEHVAAFPGGAVHSPATPFLVSFKILEKFNAEKLAQNVSITDGAAYCLEAGKVLKQHFPILIHNTCVRHAMLLSLEHVWMKKDETKDSIANWVRFGLFPTKNWEVISKWVEKLETDVIIVKEVKNLSKNQVC